MKDFGWLNWLNLVAVIALLGATVGQYQTRNEMTKTLAKLDVLYDVQMKTLGR